LERSLSATSEVNAVRIDPGSATNLSSSKISSADVFIIDAYPHWRFAASVVAALPEVDSKRGELLMLAEQYSESEAFPLLRLGVKGLLTYSEVSSQLERAVATVAKGGYWVPRSLLSRFVESMLGDESRRADPKDFPGVSPREQDVLSLLLKNHSNKEIASKLNISERTAKFHVSNLLSKYGVQRRADLILMLFQGPNHPGSLQ
jgi:DNA-binding NarL/FixJ family response regulator